MRLLAIDYGKKRIGTAISDSEGLVSNPYKLIYNLGMRYVIQKLHNIIEEYKIEKIIFGLPHHKDGKDTKLVKDIYFLSNKLINLYNIFVEYMEETYTSCEAKEKLIELKINGKKFKNKLDIFSAQIILNNYMIFNKKK